MKIFQDDLSSGDSTLSVKSCFLCGETDISKFYVDSKGKRTNTYCKECHKQECKKRWHSKTLVEKQASRVMSLYGITAETYVEMHKIQEGKCSLCGEIPTTKRGLNVDHCHKTGVVRSLLCHHCNVGLGSFKDNINLLEKAIEYLRKNYG